MTTAAIVGGLRKTAGTDLTTTNATAVFTATDRFTESITGVHICNTDSSNSCAYTIEWNDGSTDFMLFNAETLSAGDAVDIECELHFNGSGSLKVTAGNANDLHVVVSYFQVPGANALG